FLGLGLRRTPEQNWRLQSFFNIYFFPLFLFVFFFPLLLFVYFFIVEKANGAGVWLFGLLKTVP
ncbi:unnamed protein product, partial [Prunus brigantina]